MLHGAPLDDRAGHVGAQPAQRRALVGRRVGRLGARGALRRVGRHLRHHPAVRPEGEAPHVVVEVREQVAAGGRARRSLRLPGGRAIAPRDLRHPRLVGLQDALQRPARRRAGGVAADARRAAELPGLDQVVLRPEHVRRGHVRVRDDEVRDRARLVARELVDPRAFGEPGILVAVVLVDVGAARAVLVPPLVPVVVHALDVHGPPATLPLRRRRAAHEEGVDGIGHPLAGGIAHAHHRDQPVAVQVLGPVLVGRAVAVVVLLPAVRRPLGERRLEERLRRVGVGARHDVHRRSIEQTRGRAVAPVARRQPPDRAERDLAADDVRPIRVGDDEERGTRVDVLAGAEPHRVHGAPARRAGDRRHLHETWMGALQAVERAAERGVVVVAGGGRCGARGRGLRRRCGRRRGRGRCRRGLRRLRMQRRRGERRERGGGDRGAQARRSPGGARREVHDGA